MTLSLLYTMNSGLLNLLELLFLYILICPIENQIVKLATFLCEIFTICSFGLILHHLHSSEYASSCNLNQTYIWLADSSIIELGLKLLKKCQTLSVLSV
jgi:hypothetical protein